jgi:hypothetical protein
VQIRTIQYSMTDYRTFTQPCVYAVTKDYQHLYIGVGTRGFDRVFSQDDKLKKRTLAFSEGDAVTVIFYTSNLEAHEAEEQMIHNTHPKYNRACALCYYYDSQRIAKPPKFRLRTLEEKEKERREEQEEKRVNKVIREAQKQERAWQRTKMQKRWFLEGRRTCLEGGIRHFYVHKPKPEVLQRFPFSRRLWLAGYDTAMNPNSSDATMYEEMGWIPQD